mmetsp:Transcript_11603/g.16231  ORF Transcript_11603/g.16231 Transcript_11603/m.16231 type:complete len:208 (-) Transcript_11603:2074-2697(-)
MKPLPHLSTAMRHQYRAICVDVHQCSSLVHEFGSEGNSKLCRDESNSAFAPAVRLIEFLRLLDPLGVLRSFLALLPCSPNGALGENLAEVSHLPLLVQIHLTQFISRNTKVARHVVHCSFSDHQALRPSKPAEGSMARHVCLADVAMCANMRNVVDVVDVEETPVHHRDRQVQAPSRVRVELDIKCCELPLFCEPDFVLADECVALA